ncbi:MAG: aldehyde dehydrogenase, partial [Desulfatitalea sp.]|nr:proline dehydrogenase family protein [Desulfatitalea sp.]NNK01233.1 aldehyde dehydrogenase [Desulfatitalea sp.]
MHDWIDEALIKASIERAARWQVRANRLLTPDEHKQQRQFAKMLDASADKVFLVKLLDQGLRSRHPGRVADQIRFLLETYGTPRFFDPGERLLSRLFRYVGHHFSAWAVPAIIASMRKLSRQMIIPGEMDELTDFLGRRRAEGVQVNINHLGEAVLGEQEACRRLAVYLDDLKNPLVEHISVKISTLYSQLRPIAFEHDVAVLIDRLSLLYRAAQQQAFEGADGVRRPKIVHLDMEAFDDVETTLAAFRRTLAQDQFRSLTAGIVLQAYLPESFVFQQALTRWARERTAAGGAPIRLRIVKGANLEMERVQAALHGWPQAPFSYKGDVDAHFKRMLGYALQPEHLASVHLGVASHNLFELALAYEAAKRKGVQDQVAFELLAGMADHVRRALAEQGLSLLLYAPVAGRDEFLHAVAYLIRRMDENSGRGNYLRYAPMLTTDSEAWQGLSTAFVSACRRIDTTRTHPFRNQDRLAEARMTPPADPGDEGFFNVPDTDWSLAANRQWADQIRTQWQRRAGDDPVVVTPVVAGQAVAHAPDQAVFD